MKRSGLFTNALFALALLGFNAPQAEAIEIYSGENLSAHFGVGVIDHVRAGGRGGGQRHHGGAGARGGGGAHRGAACIEAAARTARVGRTGPPLAPLATSTAM